ncbi:flagellar hook-associated protein FlgK [Rubrivivax gelatinosus]|nr:flagellar hook-associated protein FlgK [Rubrivivax gelatinosus]
MSIISIALTGAQATQIALATVSQNVANSKTDGYTRQGTLLTALGSTRGGISAGDGVQVSSLQRFSDGYKNLQLWQSASELGQRQSSQPYLSQLERVMGDEEGGIGGGIDELFTALNAASVEPTSTPLRQQVISAADALSQRFVSLQQTLANQRSAIEQQRGSLAGQVSTLATGIADLNRQIASAQATGGGTSALQDERDRKIDALSSLAAVQVVEQPDGTRNVSLRNGMPLVVGARAASIEMNPGSPPTVTIAFASQSYTASGEVLGGQLGGLDDYLAKVLTPMADSVAQLASQIASSVNSTLAGGFDLDGNAGGALFQFDAGTGRIAVNPALTARQLGFSSDASKPGNSDVLQQLVELPTQSVTLPQLGSVQLRDACSQLLGDLGSRSAQNQAALATAETVRDQAEQNWKSTSGVNDDEEAASLIQYQQMYQANLKVIAVANELFDSTLQMFG